jgi:U3 small nucleolar RNA-associated protein 19
MLALSGIFHLVTRHGLEYPAFYTRLYGLLAPAAFGARHRAQFFQLMDVFLASGMVPAYTAAAFAKRLARLALSGPPGAAMVALAFIHNLIRRHPSTMVMLHNPRGAARAEAAATGDAPLLLGGDSDGNANGGAGTPDIAGAAGRDVYDPNAVDPAASRAVESSLWEVAALRAHYAPAVAAFAAVLDKDLTDRARTSEVDVDGVLGASYGSLMAEELERKLKTRVPVAAHAAPPTALFGSGGVASGAWAGWAV